MASRKSIKQMALDAEARKGTSASQLSYAIRHIDDVTGQIKSPVTAEAERLINLYNPNTY